VVNEIMVDKINWQRAGRVAQPGRYMFTFGWLTVTAEDIGVWERFPEATFTLVKLPDVKLTDHDAVAEEFHLGAFEIPLTGAEASQHRAQGETGVA
jgi:hypothetical protein